jgi:hypothetical protein
MIRLRSLGAGIVGAVIATVLVLACSDDSPGPADAATSVCTCPAAEPPLTDRVVLEVFNDVGSIPPEGGGFVGNKSCSNPNAIVLAGGCLQRNGGDNITLVDSSPGDKNWRCSWRKAPGGGTVALDMILKCLNPAPAK